VIEPEETIVIDVGTTALEVARALPATFRGRVLTSSVTMRLEQVPLFGAYTEPGGAC